MIGPGTSLGLHVQSIPHLAGSKPRFDIARACEWIRIVMRPENALFSKHGVPMCCLILHAQLFLHVHVFSKLTKTNPRMTTCCEASLTES
jgi:hypothetical protein